MRHRGPGQAPGRSGSRATATKVQVSLRMNRLRSVIASSVRLACAMSAIKGSNDAAD